MAEQLPTTEIASVDRDPMVPQYQTTLRPEDETLKARAGGRGISLYDEIRRDPHAYAVLNKRVTEVVSREWKVQQASDRRLDKRAADAVRDQLKALDFDRLTKGLMGAILKGFAVAEVLWELRDGIWWAVKIKVRKQRRFRFTADGELRLTTRQSMIDGEPVPGRKFIVHRFSLDNEDDDPYGLGLGSVLFWPAWFKRQVLAHWLKSSENHSDPTTKGTYPGDWDDEKQKKLLAAMRNARRGGSIAVPDGITIEQLSAPSDRNTGQESLARYLDEMMSEAVLGETLTTNSGDRGARSLGEVHNDVRIAIAKADADLLSATINETLVRWIVEVNFPGAGLPTVWRDFEEGEDLDARVKRDQTLDQMGYRPSSVDQINETYGGDWIDTRAAAPATPAAAIGALFAEAVPADDPLGPLIDRTDAAAAPTLAAMLEKIRGAVVGAASYDEAAERLLALMPSLDPSGLADALEQALVIADLAGRAEVGSSQPEG